MKKIKEEKQIKKQNKRIEIRNEKIKMERGITILALVITIVLNCVCHEKVERLL